MEIKSIASGSSGNAYVVSDGDTSILLECGVPIKKIQEALDYKLASTVSACFITHEHLDHCQAVEDILKAGIDCYASLGTWFRRGRTCDHQVRPMYADGEGDSYSVVPIGSLQVRAFAVQHDAAEPLGFLIDSDKTGERLLYFTDTFYLKYRFEGVTHIMAECNYCEDTLQRMLSAASDDAVDVNKRMDARLIAQRLAYSHMSLENLLEMLRANDLTKLRQIYLLHLSNERADADKMKMAVQKLTGAEVYVC